MQQCFAVRLVERCFEQWKDEVQGMDAMKERADQAACLESWASNSEGWSSEIRMSLVGDRLHWDVCRRGWKK